MKFFLDSYLKIIVNEFRVYFLRVIVTLQIQKVPSELLNRNRRYCVLLQTFACYQIAKITWQEVTTAYSAPTRRFPLRTAICELNPLGKNIR